MKKILLVVHQVTSEPGLVGQLLAARGYPLEICCPAIGHSLPTQIDDYQAVVIFGGPMSANDSEALPFIRAELNWLPLVLAAQKPFLGICLGAQLLARTLGATVTSHPQQATEIGYFPIQPTVAGKLYFRQPMMVYHWHREGFELPRDAVLLAQGETFSNQAFCYGNTAFGVQFHPEMTRSIMERWLVSGAEHLTQPGAQPAETHLQGHQLYAPAVQSWLESFLDSWLGVTHPYNEIALR